MKTLQKLRVRVSSLKESMCAPSHTKAGVELFEASVSDRLSSSSVNLSVSMIRTSTNTFCFRTSA